VVDRPAALLRGAAAKAGFRELGDQMLRVDLAERLARQAHDARDGRRPFVPDPSLSTSLGLRPAAVARLMRALGFGSMNAGWVWRGSCRADAVAPRRPIPRSNPFGVLSALQS
jgi:ATP-dependent RNA helicase SUPV3L1/SUV3